MPSPVSAAPPLRFLYDSEDLLETIIQIEDESLRDDTEDDIDGPDSPKALGFINKPPDPDMRSLQRLHRNVPHLRQLGVDDHPLLATNAPASPLPLGTTAALRRAGRQQQLQQCQDSIRGKGSNHSNSNSCAKQSGSGGGGGNDMATKEPARTRVRRRVNPEHPAAAGWTTPRRCGRHRRLHAAGDAPRPSRRRRVLHSCGAALRVQRPAGLPAPQRLARPRPEPRPLRKRPGGAATPGEAWQQHPERLLRRAPATRGEGRAAHGCVKKGVWTEDEAL